MVELIVIPDMMTYDDIRSVVGALQWKCGLKIHVWSGYTLPSFTNEQYIDKTQFWVSNAARGDFGRIADNLVEEANKRGIKYLIIVRVDHSPFFSVVVCTADSPDITQYVSVPYVNN